MARMMPVGDEPEPDEPGQYQHATREDGEHPRARDVLRGRDRRHARQGLGGDDPLEDGIRTPQTPSSASSRPDRMASMKAL